MKHYALIFHPTRTLTPEDRSTRAADIAVWVKTVTDMGITLDPRLRRDGCELLLRGKQRLSPVMGSSNPTALTIVFFDSPRQSQAVDIVRVHPGLHYGVTVEVREWVSPREIVLNK